MTGYPPFPSSAEGGGVVLHEEVCRIDIGEEHTQTHARVVLDIGAYPSACIEIRREDLDDIAFTHANNGAVNVTCLDSGLKLRGGRLSISRDRPNMARIVFGDPVSAAWDGTVAHATALLYNATPFCVGRVLHRRPVLTLSFPPLTVDIGPLHRTEESVASALESPWFRITNELNIRIEGEVSANQLDNLLFDLREFLSFAWGRYVGIGLARGWDASENLTFAHWGMIRPDPLVPVWRPPHWFPSLSAESLNQIVPGYQQRSKDPNWRDVVEWGIYWFLSANNPAQRSEAATMVSVAGLEALAKKLLDDGVAVERECPGCKRCGSRAAKRLRGMLHALRVPTEIPLAFNDLRRHVEQNSWDGPEVVTNIRNSITHPGRTGVEQAAYEASQLALWYLELSLLYAFDYTGHYVNRTVIETPRHTTEKVPWAV